MLAAAQATSTPTWPSLYDIGIELFPIEHEAPIHEQGSYLHNANVIFRFTLYWTLIFYTPAFVLCGTYAFLNLTFPPRRQRASQRRPSLVFPFYSSYLAVPAAGGDIPLQAYGPDGKKNIALQYRSRTMQNEKRSRLTFGLLVWFAYAVFAVTGAVIGSALIGYVLAGLYQAGDYNMSTWMPFLAALIQTLVGYLGLWPSVVDII